MNRRYDARAVVLMLFFVSLCRLTLEVAPLPQITVINCYSRLLVYINFYLVMFFSFTLLLKIVAGLSFEKAAKPASVGLLFGLAPPLIDYLSGVKQPRYQYFKEFEPLLTADYLPVGETIVLWMLVAVVFFFVCYLTRSLLRGALAAIGTYIIIQLHGFFFVWLICSSDMIFLQPHIRSVILSVINLLVSFIVYAILRGPPVLSSITRFNHALPHFMLAVSGAVWAGYGFGNGVIKGLIVLLFFVFLLIQNDCYDRDEDQLANRKENTTLDDVTWSSFFVFCLLFSIAQVNFVMVLMIVICFVAGFLYHHPSVRLKERFCLSYKIEGIWALMAFLAGAASPTGFSGHDLLLPSILLFGGGTLISIPKDWKDVTSDRLAKIPTYYVVLTHRGQDEYIIHRRIVACATLGLMILPILLFFGSGFSVLNAVFLLSSGGPAWALLALKDRKKAVKTMLWLLSGYLFLLSLVLRQFTGQPL